jgi:hypothetical protein
MAEPDLDTDKLDDAALAILSLTLHDGNRAWKGFDRSVTDRLHAKGLILEPIGKAKSLALTENGLARAEAVLTELFSKPQSTNPQRSEP